MNGLSMWGVTMITELLGNSSLMPPARRFLVLLLCVAACLDVVLTSSMAPAQTREEQKVLDRAIELKRLLDRCRPGNTRAQELDQMSREAFKAGQTSEALRLLDEAICVANEKDPSSPPASGSALPPAAAAPPPGLQAGVSISFPVSASRVLCTAVVPNADSGNLVTDYRSAFSQETLSARQGTVRLTIGASPVILEELPDGTSEQSNDPAPGIPAFGLHGIENNLEANLACLEDLGVNWVVYAGPFGAIWDVIEPSEARLDWSKNDLLYGTTYQKGIQMMPVILAANAWDQSTVGRRPKHRMPTHRDEYRHFLERLVTRYSGSDRDNAPGSPVIRFWQIENEVDTRQGWQDTIENYGELLRLSYKAVKSADPQAMVAIAGISSPKGYYDFYVPLFDYMRKKYPGQRFFDLVSFHWSGQFKGTYKSVRIGDKSFDMQTFLQDLKADVDSFGNGSVPIWITELSDYDGKPNADPIDGEYQYASETKQAISLFKLHVHALALGVQRIFWSTLLEFHNWGGLSTNNYFDNIGLINNPLNDGKSSKKLSYYTYKLMVEKLKNCRFDNAEIAYLDDGVVAYKFTHRRPVYVLWRD